MVRDRLPVEQYRRGPGQARAVHRWDEPGGRPSFSFGRGALRSGPLAMCLIVLLERHRLYRVQSLDDSFLWVWTPQRLDLGISYYYALSRIIRPGRARLILPPLEDGGHFERTWGFAARCSRGEAPEHRRCVAHDTDQGALPRGP